MTQILKAELNPQCLMNTQNTIEKNICEEKGQKNPGANSQVYILNLSHRFANVLFFGWTTPFCEKV